MTSSLNDLPSKVCNGVIVIFFSILMVAIVPAYAITLDDYMEELFPTPEQSPPQSQSQAPIVPPAQNNQNDNFIENNFGNLNRNSNSEQPRSPFSIPSIFDDFIEL